jgi:uncharacterized tellurite resistance protein B-like protein
MLASLKNLLGELASGAKHASRFAENDYRIGAAALLIHAAAIDGNMTEKEQEKLRVLLKQRFELDDDATSELIEQATTAEHDAVDLYHFTSTLNRVLDEAGRRRIVEMMWEMVYADGRVTEFEDNLIWRAADLLFVPSRERIEIRHRVAAKSAAPDAGMID